MTAPTPEQIKSLHPLDLPSRTDRVEWPEIKLAFPLPDPLRDYAEMMEACRAR